LHNTLLFAVSNGAIGADHAQGILTSVRAFIGWLYESEVLEQLPRNLLSKSLRIAVPAKQLRSFGVEEVRKVYATADEKMRLYMLLALNCGMTQIDISQLRPADINWQKATLSRKRGKTQKFESVPFVVYALWPETLSLLKKFKSVDSERLLHAPIGGPLKVEIERDGKISKNDYIGLKIRRLLKKIDLPGQFKMLKKTSGSLLRDHEIYNGLEGLFLDHAPRSTSDKHYAAVPTKLLADALNWLRGQLQLKKSTRRSKTKV
jgi:integrase